MTRLCESVKVRFADCRAQKIYRKDVLPRDTRLRDWRYGFRFATRRDVHQTWSRWTVSVPAPTAVHEIASAKISVSHCGCNVLCCKCMGTGLPQGIRGSGYQGTLGTLTTARTARARLRAPAAPPPPPPTVAARFKETSRHRDKRGRVVSASRAGNGGIQYDKYTNVDVLPH